MNSVYKRIDDRVVELIQVPSPVDNLELYTYKDSSVGDANLEVQRAEYSKQVAGVEVKNMCMFGGE